MGLRSSAHLIALLISLAEVAAQGQPAQRALSLEFAGVSQGVSLNYDWILSRHERRFLCARVGLGANNQYGPEVSIPHGLTFNFGKKKSFLEVGLLGSLGPTTFGYADASSTLYFFAPMVGYRRHPARGFAFKLYFTTFIPAAANPEVIPFGGISFGITLNKKDKGS